MFLKFQCLYFWYGYIFVIKRFHYIYKNKNCLFKTLNKSQAQPTGKSCSCSSHNFHRHLQQQKIDKAERREFTVTTNQKSPKKRIITDINMMVKQSMGFPSTKQQPKKSVINHGFICHIVIVTSNVHVGDGKGIATARSFLLSIFSVYIHFFKTIKRYFLLLLLQYFHFLLLSRCSNVCAQPNFHTLFRNITILSKRFAPDNLQIFHRCMSIIMDFFPFFLMHFISVDKNALSNSCLSVYV